MERILIPAFLATGVAIATLSGCGSGDRAPVAESRISSIWRRNVSIEQCDNWTSWNLG
jgi:hypothetical protein